MLTRFALASTAVAAAYALCAPTPASAEDSLPKGSMTCGTARTYLNRFSAQPANVEGLEALERRIRVLCPTEARLTRDALTRARTELAAHSGEAATTTVSMPTPAPPRSEPRRSPPPPPPPPPPAPEVEDVVYEPPAEPVLGPLTPITAAAMYGGEIHQGDPLTGEGGIHYDEYAITLTEGQSVEFVLRSQAIMPLLAVGVGRLPDDFSLSAYDEALESDDADARVQFVAPGDGEYVVVVASTDNARLGGYTLESREWAPPPPPPPRPIAFNQAVPSELTRDGSARLPEGQAFELWRFDGEGGQALRISLVSDAFDAFVSLGRMRDGVFEELVYDDDGGENLNSLLTFTLPESGQYVIQARSFGPSGIGPYELRVDVPRSRERARIGDANGWVVHGALGDASATDDSFNAYQDYEFPVRRNRRYAVTVTSSEFTPIVDVGEIRRRGEVREVDYYQDDDPRLPGQVEFDASDNGRYLLRVRGFDGRVGAFQISVTELAQ